MELPNWNQADAFLLKHLYTASEKKHMGILFDCFQLMSILRSVHVEIFSGIKLVDHYKSKKKNTRFDD